jgi:hypothetical protein
VSSYKVILEVSKLLQTTLWSGFAGDNALTQYVANQDAIVLLNPADAAKQANHKISLWLYQVQQNEFLRNQVPLRVPQHDDQIQFQPLVLNLYYLLTPSTESVEGDQMVLGRSMQIFNDNATLLLQSQEDPGVSQELRVSMCQRDLRELAEVWEALQQPYRLSVCYEIRITQIDSTRTLRTGRVKDRASTFQNTPQVVGA